MGKINVLDFHVANLIAAGEVVDRPASVVKELLENAIDAGGNSITVEIKRGGVSFIRVSDNGCGMSREDVPISLKRHATSKIRCAEDLNAIETLGFRGEALAAISSVSQMRIMTKRREDGTGTLLEASGGRVTAVSDTGCPDGTTVLVENLFYNTPARLKFLKKDGTEAANVAAYVEKIALSHPEIGIRFISDGDLKYATVGDNNRRSTIYAVLGRDFSKKMMEINGGFDGVSVSGYIGTPENYRGNRNLQIFFINNRFIRSKTVSAALEQAYTTYIPADKFPCAVLYLQMNPAMVDVNVHPAKLEVKFSNERLIFESVYYAVRGALEQNLSRPEMQWSHTAEKRKEQRDAINAFVPGKEGRGGEGKTEAHETRRTLDEGIQPSVAGEKPTDDKPLSDLRTHMPAAEASEQTAVGMNYAFGEKSSHLSVEPLFAADPDMSVPTHIRKAFEEEKPPAVSMKQNRTDTRSGEDISRSGAAVSDVHTADALAAHAVEKPHEKAAAEREPETEKVPLPGLRIPEYRIVGEVFRCYVILETGDTMYLVDKHAAHERILFEAFKACGKQTRNEQSVQMLLMPLVIALSTDEAVTASDFADELFSAGFTFEIKDRQAHITQIPAFLDTAAARDAFCEAVTRLAENSGTAELTREQHYEKALFQASCKAAIKAGRDYDEAHLKWICDQVMSNPEIRYCPHGRPVCFEMTKAAIEGRFGRT